MAQAAGRHLLHMTSPPGRFLDLGCGDGALSRVMAAAGFDVLGLDASPAMVALARQRVPAATFDTGDIRTARLPEAEVIAAVGEVLDYACADGHPLDALLARIHAALSPRGLLLFDVATTGRAARRTQALREGDGWRMRATAEETEGHLVRTIETWRLVDGEERRRQEVHRLRLFDVDHVMMALDVAGFDATPVGGYDDFGFQHGWDGFEARKR